MTRNRFSRRDLLQYGGAAGALLWPIIRARWANASIASRFVVFYFPNGPSKDPEIDFFPGPGRNWTGRTTERLGQRSAALGRPYSDVISFVKPLMLNTGYGFGNTGNRQDVGQHTDGMAALLTGAEPVWLRNNHTAAGGKSLDEHLVQAGAERLYLGERPSTIREYRISWRGREQPNNPITDPKAAYQEILPALVRSCGAQMPSSPSMGPSPSQKAAAQEKLILDTLALELKSARRIFGLAADELQKLERFEEAMAEIESRLTLDGANSTGTPAPAGSAACPGGKPPSIDGLPTTTMLDRVRLHTKVMALAVAMGGYRTALLQLEHGYSNADYSFIEGVNKGGHHSMQHAARTVECNLITKWHMERFADLLDALAGFRESEGTVLDNCVVMAGADVPAGETHLFTKPHTVLVAGGGGGRLRQGVDVLSRHNHIDLLATLAEILGTDSAHFRKQQGFGSIIDGLMA